MKNDHKKDWNPTSRHDSLKDALPFLGLLLALAALIGGLIYIMEYLD